ncbi:MAG: D-ribose pyranase [Pelosinus sp.]|jgi:D-ribose pyranase|nr:D-ribose pyranase [Pelosinus sp.]
MKKIGTLHQGISKVIAGMGHGDMLVIGDCGLPIPPEVRRIDLALTAGVPTFLQTLSVVQQELEIESVVMANEMLQISPELYATTRSLLGDIPVETVSHEEFKKMTKQAVAVIRTGECTAYANIILKSGVFF